MKQKECFEKFVDLHNEFLEALEMYMSECGISVKEIADKTTLSIKTVKRFLKNYHLREESYRKLLKLGDGFYRKAESSLMKSLAEMESKAKSRTMFLSLHPHGDYFINP